MHNPDTTGVGAGREEAAAGSGGRGGGGAASGGARDIDRGGTAGRRASSRALKGPAPGGSMRGSVDALPLAAVPTRPVRCENTERGTGCQGLCGAAPRRASRVELPAWYAQARPRHRLRIARGRGAASRGPRRPRWSRRPRRPQVHGVRGAHVASERTEGERCAGGRASMDGSRTGRGVGATTPADHQSGHRTGARGRDSVQPGHTLCRRAAHGSGREGPLRWRRRPAGGADPAAGRPAGPARFPRRLRPSAHHKVDSCRQNTRWRRRALRGDWPALFFRFVRAVAAEPCAVAHVLLVLDRDRERGRRLKAVSTCFDVLSCAAAAARHTGRSAVRRGRRGARRGPRSAIR